MLKLILRRFLEAIPTMLVLITVSFFVMRLAPGSPFTGERNLPPAVLANIEAKYHLNDPIWLQYLNYLKQLAHGDLGPSFKYKDYSVNELLAQALPVSLEVGVYAFIIAVIVGMLLGIFAALKQNSFLDYGTMALAMTGVVVPSFVKGPLMVLVFAVMLKWFPAGGWNGGAVQNMVLPVFVLSLSYIAGISRIMRGSMIEVMNSPFIRTARAKGLSTPYIVLKTIFGLPGIGQLFVNGALNRDYGMVLGLTILVGVLTILFNAVVDILYAMIDPKIRID